MIGNFIVNNDSQNYLVPVLLGCDDQASNWIFNEISITNNTSNGPMFYIVVGNGVVTTMRGVYLTNNTFLGN